MNIYSNYSYQHHTLLGTQQQQQRVNGHVWNGTSWVPEHPTPQQQSVLSSQVIKHGMTHSQLVQRYTTQYHGWNSHQSEAKSTLAALPPPHPNTPSNNAKRDEWERREKWAAYYARTSALLAHYHLALSNGGAEPYVRPQSPPVPPQLAGNSTGSLGNQQAQLEATAASGRATSAPEVSCSSSSDIDQPCLNRTKPEACMLNKENNQKKKTVQSSSATSVGIDNVAQLLLDEKVASKRPSTAEADKEEPRKKKSRADTTGKFSVPGTGLNRLYSNFVQDGTTSAGSGTEKGGSKTKNILSRDLTKGKRKISTENVNGGSTYDAPSLSSLNNDDYLPLRLHKPLQGGKKKKRGSKLLDGFDNNAAIMKERAARFTGKGGISSSALGTKNLASSVDKYMGKSTIGGSSKKLSDVDYERMTVKGTCIKLEKDYLRLTSPPKAELVRPQNILEHHLSNIINSYYEMDKVHNGKSRDYMWYCSQLKAIRQDLTVQRILNSFSVKVYETHAKIALEEEDINEYNQSQTQLKELYELMERRVAQIGSMPKMGKAKKDQVKDAIVGLQNRNEFIAYRIIYYVFLSGNRKYDGGSSDIFKIMLTLSPKQRGDPCIHHALLVRAAVAENDYHKFFQLQDTAPNMADLLMDKIVPHIRQGALQRIVKAYRPSVSAEFVLRELGFDTKNRAESENGKAWMISCGCKFDDTNMLTKDTVLKESGMGAKNSLI